MEINYNEVIKQLKRVSKNLGAIGETEDLTDIAIDAVEKQSAQKPIKGQDKVTNFCPSCLLKVDGQLTRPIVGYAGTQFFHHCPWCGQKLDWGKQNVIS